MWLRQSHLELEGERQEELGAEMAGPEGLSKKRTLNIPLKPWREIVTPHPDVAAGRYRQAEFAADLAQVLSGKAEAEYRYPPEIF